MIRIAQLFICLLLLTSNGICLDYVYYSNDESLDMGTDFSWQPVDSIIGNIYTTDCFQCSENGAAYFDGMAYMACDESNCLFDSVVHLTEIDSVDFEWITSQIRREASAEGLANFDQPEYEYRLSIREDACYVYYWEEGAPFDSMNAHRCTVQLGHNTCISFDQPLSVHGVLSQDNADLEIVCSRDIVIIDNLIIEGTDLTTGELPPDTESKILLASEGSIYIGDTYANGKCNSGGLGQNQTNPDSTGIVVTAVIVAGGSEGGLRIEHPNNPGDTFISPCFPDERGTFILNGALWQRRRGVLHNSNNEGTGYRLHWTFDNRYSDWSFNPNYFSFEPDTMDFGPVPIGSSRTDTLTVEFTSEASLSYAGSWESIHAVSLEETGTLFHILVTFTPSDTSSDLRSVSVGFSQSPFYFRPYVLVRGYGVQTEDASSALSQPFDITLSAYPNPFNPETTIRFDLPNAGLVSLDIFNINGRRVQSLPNKHFTAGSHSIDFNGSSLPSGVYFANLRSGTELKTIKLLLMK